MIHMYRQTANVMISLIGGLRETARQIINKNGEEMAHANLHKMTKLVEGDQTGDGYHYVQPWLAEQLIEIARKEIGRGSAAHNTMRYLAMHDWENRHQKEGFDVREYAMCSIAHMLFMVQQGYVVEPDAWFSDLDTMPVSTGKYEKEVAEADKANAEIIQDYADDY